MTAPRTIAVVDPLSSPKFLGGSLKSKGFRTVAVFHLEPSQEVLGFHRPEFFDVVVNAHALTEDEVVDTLVRLDTDFVLYGSEFSVEYADRLAVRICPGLANDMATSRYRCDKAMMNRALADHGWKTIREMTVDGDLDEASIGRVAREFDYPVIIKPTRAVATQGFAKCRDSAELRSSFANARRQRSALSSESYLIQEFVEGDEYVIDTASLAGKHYVSDVFRNVKRYLGDSNIYLRSEIVSSDEEVWPLLTEYVTKVLDLIGLRNGLAHTEVFLTADGPLLLEVNPRIAGASGFLNRISSLVYGWSQPDLLADLLTGTDLTGLDHRCGSFGMLVYLNNWQNDHVVTDFNIPQLSQLSTFVEGVPLKKVGELAQPPVTLLDIAAFVLLHGPDRRSVEQDYATLVEWEKAGVLF